MSNALHYLACWGDESSDQKLIELAKQMADLKSDPRIERELKFLLLERALIEFGADEKAPFDLPVANQLLDQGYAFCSSNRLLDRHLRLASNLIRVANLLDSENETESQKWKQRRAKEFARFGALFEKSADLRMSRYGKSLADSDSGPDAHLGQPLELAGEGLGGEAIDINDFAGKLVIVDFWATWCGPCVREMPQLVKLYAEMADQEFEIIGVNLDDDLEDVHEFTAQHEIGWLNVVGEDAQRIAKQYSVGSIPMMMLIDGEGKILLIKSRVSDLAAELKKQMDAK